MNTSSINNSIMNDSSRFINLSRRNTVAGSDSPYNSRRHLVLQSTPINMPRTLKSRVPTLDLSEIVPVPSTEENNLRPVEDRSFRPHLFGKVTDAEDATKQRLETSLHPNSSFNFESMDVDRASIFLPPGNTLPRRPVRVDRQNTFNVTRNEVANGIAKEPKKTISFIPPTKELLKPKAGPPLRSLNDFKPAVKRPRLAETWADEPKRQISPEDQEDYWVTVSGFDPNTQTDDVLELFGRHGQIVQSGKPADGYNFLYIRYATTVHVDQALDRSGQLIGKNMIAVFRKKKNAELRSVTDPDRVWTDREKDSATVSFTSNVRPSLSGPRNESKMITGMRSAAVASAPNHNGSSPGIMGRIFSAFK